MKRWASSSVFLLGLVSCAPKPPGAPERPMSQVSALAPASVMVTTSPPPPPEAPAAPVTADERARFYQGCWAAFNAKDWAAFSGCYADGASSEQVGSGFPVAIGRAEVVRSSEGFASQFPDARGELELTLVGGDELVAVVLLKGTNLGALRVPGGATAPATNKPLGLFLAHAVEMTGDGRSVARERFYLDAGSMMGQLGLHSAPHRKLVEQGSAEKLVVLATNGEVEKANLALVAKGTEAFNKKDVNALVGMMTDDVVLSEASAPVDKVGKAAVKKAYQELFKGFSDVRIEVVKTWAAGDYVVTEGVMSGTNDGDMPSWKLKKTGKKVSARFLELDKLEAGKRKNLWVFDNGLSLSSQLGLLPPPGALVTSSVRFE